MNIYLVERTDKYDYDEFDSFVVAAECEDHARDTNPLKIREYGTKQPVWYTEMIDWSDPDHGCWTKLRANVKVTLIGTAAPGIPFGVICASFNAG